GLRGVNHLREVDGNGDGSDNRREDEGDDPALDPVDRAHQGIAGQRREQPPPATTDAHSVAVALRLSSKRTPRWSRTVEGVSNLLPVEVGQMPLVRRRSRGGQQIAGFVFFDFFGTLVDYDPSIHPAYNAPLAFARRAGSAISEDASDAWWQRSWDDLDNE